MGELGKREGGGFLLRFGWCRGSARKRMLILGFFYFPATGAGLWQGFQSKPVQRTVQSRTRATSKALTL